MLPIGAWGKAEMPFEGLSQVALIRKSALYCNVSKRHIPLFEQTLRSLDALAQHKLLRAFSRRLPEQACKVIGTKSGLPSQCPQSELLTAIIPNEGHHTPPRL